jgi:hypothetical protein
MEDLYLKENPFNISNVTSNVESSGKAPMVADVEAPENNKDEFSQKFERIFLQV